MSNQESKPISAEELENVSGGRRRLSVGQVKPYQQTQSNADVLTREALKTIDAAGQQVKPLVRSGDRQPKADELSREALKNIDAAGHQLKPLGRAADRREMIRRARKAGLGSAEAGLV